MITAPPMPVPRVTSTTSDRPVPAPSRCSATPAQLASLSTVTAASPVASATATPTSRPVTPGQVGCDLQHPAAIDQSGDAHAHPGHAGTAPILELAVEVGDGPSQSLHHRLGARGRVSAVVHQRLPRVGRVQDPAQDLGPADIEAGHHPPGDGAGRSGPVGHPGQ